MHRIGYLTDMKDLDLELEDTPIWRIVKINGRVVPALVAWYTPHEERNFLISRTFSTKTEADTWLKEFWEAYWNLGK